MEALARPGHVDLGLDFGGQHLDKNDCLAVRMAGTASRLDSVQYLRVAKLGNPNQKQKSWFD